MSTIVQTPNQNANGASAQGSASAAPLGKVYMETYVRLAEFKRGDDKTDENGEVIRTRSVETSVMGESTAEKRIEAAKKLRAIQDPTNPAQLIPGPDWDLVPEIQVRQSCNFVEAKAASEFIPLCTTAGKEDVAESIAIKHFNRGAVLTQQQEVRELLGDASFEPVEGVLSLAYAIAQKSESRAKSPQEKAAKLLGVSADQIAMFLEMFKAQREAGAAGA